MKILLFIAGLGAIWDFFTSFRGTFAIMQVEKANLFSSLFELTTSLLVCLVITVLDFLFIDRFFSNNNSLNLTKKYAVLFFWSICKTYDLWTAFLGTAVAWFDEEFSSGNFDSINLSEVFFITTFSQRIVLFMICIVISACPMYLCWHFSSNNKYKY